MSGVDLSDREMSGRLLDAGGQVRRNAARFRTKARAMRRGSAERESLEALARKADEDAMSILAAAFYYYEKSLPPVPEDNVRRFTKE